MKTTIILGPETPPIEMESLEVAVQVGPYTIEVGVTGLAVINHSTGESQYVSYAPEEE